MCSAKECSEYTEEEKANLYKFEGKIKEKLGLNTNLSIGQTNGASSDEEHMECFGIKSEECSMCC